MSFNVLGIGEVLWDLLPDGRQLGGAPTNFAYHAHALGAHAEIITRVGTDPRGAEILQRIKQLGLSVRGVQQDDTAPTGVVTVALSGCGIPEYTIHENVAWDRINAEQEALVLVRAAHVVCFGTLAQRSPISRQAIQRLLASASADAWRVCDINLRQNYFNREVIEHSLQLANVLKLNDGELAVLAQMFPLEGDVCRQLEALARRFSLRVVALTCGAKGSVLYREGSWSERSTTTVKVKDTVGAGDAFTAALCLGLLRRLDLDDINDAANRLAAHVCSCAGAMPELPEELRQLFNPTSELPA